MPGKVLNRRDYKATPGEFYGTPKEIWGFRMPARSGAPAAVARAFLTDHLALFKLEPGLRGLGRPKVVKGLRSTHVIFGQRHLKRRVHRAYVTVHMDTAGRVYYVKNRAVPAELLPETFEARLTRARAIDSAKRALPGTRRAKPGGTEEIWFPRKRTLVPAWKVRLSRTGPPEEWNVYVDARSGRLLSRYDNLATRAPGPGRGLVFDPSPVTALGDHALLLTPAKVLRRPPPVAYREVVLADLDGRGRLDGPRVTTRPTRNRIKRRDLDFTRLSHERGFEEVMVYYHIDATVQYLERLGYRGRRQIFDGPIEVNVNGSRADDSWFDPTDKRLTFGTGAIDDAEDAEIIVHELGHAIQDAICPEFGQSSEAAAMGEGFGDYLAASVFESRKPERYRTSVMSWDGLRLGLAQGAEPPCLRRVDEPFTYQDFDEDGDEHDNGPIWSATLWDVRLALGQETADRLIIESHFQQDPHTTFARGARAIIDADRLLERGRHVAALKRIFRARKIGPL